MHRTISLRPIVQSQNAIISFVKPQSLAAFCNGRGVASQTSQPNTSEQSSSSTKKSGGGGKALLVIAAGAAASSAIIYWKRDEEPYKGIYQLFAGSSSPSQPVVNQKQQSTPTQTIKPKLVESQSTIKTEAKVKSEQTKPKTPVAAVAEKQTDTAKDEKVKSDIEFLDNELAKANEYFEEKVKQTLVIVDKKVQEALAAKDKLSDSILKSAKELKRTTDELKDDATDALFQAANSVKLAAAQVAHDAGSDANNYLDQLTTILNEARANSKTKSNALIANIQANIDSFHAELEVAESKLRRSEIESRVITEYKQLLKDARKLFASELEAVLPNVTAQSLKNIDNLTKNDLNSFIAHAHVKVDELRRQFIEYQLRAEQKMATMLQQERAENEANYQKRLQAEVQKINSEQNSRLEERLNVERTTFEEELRNQMRRQAAAHSKHIEEVLAAYKEQCDAETATKIQEALSKERDEFFNIQQASLQRLQTIEQTLDSRKLQDAENRRAKELWLACQNLLESIVHGRKAASSDSGRRAPLANQLIVIREHCGSGDGALTQLFEAFSDEALHSGVYTETDLRTRFERVAQLCRRTALLEDETAASSATVYTYLLSALQSLLVFSSHRTYEPDERLDLAHLPNTNSLIERASYHIGERRDIATAIRLLSLLRGEPARLARSWIEDARKHVETKQTAELLLAHAAAQSLRTHY